MGLGSKNEREAECQGEPGCAREHLMNSIPHQKEEQQSEAEGAWAASHRAPWVAGRRRGLCEAVTLGVAGH